MTDADETRIEKLTRAVVVRIPRPVAAAPERVLINIACILIGVSALTTARPGSLLRLWPHWFSYEWAAAMLLGGVFALVGYWHSQRSVERLGYILVGAATTTYAVAVIWVFHWSGLASGLIYIGIAGAKLVRLLVSSAARSAIIQSGRKPDQRPL